MSIILKQGILPADQTYDLICRNCNSQIRFTASEGSLGPGFGPLTRLTFICPVCGSDVYHELWGSSISNLLPYYQRELVFWSYDGSQIIITLT